MDRTYLEDGRFREIYRACSCCRLKLHAYHYPLNRRAHQRTMITCVACKRDCRGRTACELGKLHA